MNLNLNLNVLGAGYDRLRDLVVPDALAGAIGAGVGGIPGVGMLWGGAGGRREQKDGELEGKVEKMKEELDELLAKECPLCEGVVVGLDKPFVATGEDDPSWHL